MAYQIALPSVSTIVQSTPTQSLRHNKLYVISFQEIGSNNYCFMPWTPKKIRFKSGDTILAEYNIMDLGTVAQAVGTGLRSVSWDGIFPGETFKDVDFPWYAGTLIPSTEWHNPEHYQGQLSMWHKSYTKLRLYISGTPIDMTVKILNYEMTYKDGYGNYHYSIELQEDKDLKFTVTLPESDATQGTEREVDTEFTNYTVKNGDTLWGIAACYLGSGLREKDIYELNKDVIEEAAKKRGYKSSNNGWWIFTGTVLKLPISSSSTTAGGALALNNAPVYISSSATAVATRVTGTYYLYDGKEVLGRYRICSSQYDVGKTPVGKHVTGWLPKEYANT